MRFFALLLFLFCVSGFVAAGEPAATNVSTVQSAPLCAPSTVRYETRERSIMTTQTVYDDVPVEVVEMVPTEVTETKRVARTVYEDVPVTVTKMVPTKVTKTRRVARQVQVPQTFSQTVCVQCIETPVAPAAAVNTQSNDTGRVKLRNRIRDRRANRTGQFANASWSLR